MTRSSISIALTALVLGAAPLRAQAADATPPAAPAAGRITLTLESQILGEPRVINVYTPPGYDSAAAYPVVYMPDGGLEEDFPHVSGTLDSLIALAVIEPVILVGIENTERRRDMTGPTTVASDSAIAPRVGGSAAFRAFIRDELIPHVERRWRTTGERAIVGESLAGLFIVETFLREPALFDRYIALSPSLWWNGGSLLAEAGALLAGHDRQARILYLSDAGEEGIAAETAALARTLGARAPAGLVWHHEPRPDLGHGTIYRAVAPEAFAKVLW